MPVKWLGQVEHREPVRGRPGRSRRFLGYVCPQIPRISADQSRRWLQRRTVSVPSAPSWWLPRSPPLRGSPARICDICGQQFAGLIQHHYQLDPVGLS